MKELPKTLATLLDEGVISIAQKPAGNPGRTDVPVLSATFIEHDYPGRTPILWNTIYREFDIEAQSIMFVGDTENVSVVLEAAKHDQRYVGGGVGIGFKDAIIGHLDEMDPLAEAVGAVNVVKKTENGLLRGYNTDGIGYRESLEKVLHNNARNLTECNVVMLGAGGTANAIAMSLAEAGAHIVILNRTVEKATDLASRVNRFVGSTVATAGGEDAVPDAVAHADVIINVSTKGAVGRFEECAALAPATSEGQEKNLEDSRKILSALSKHVIVSDVILRDGKTPTLLLAEEVGLETLDGIPMVINQAVEAMWIVHGDTLQNCGASKDEIRKILQTLS